MRTQSAHVGAVDNEEPREVCDVSTVNDEDRHENVTRHDHDDRDDVGAI